MSFSRLSTFHRRKVIEAKFLPGFQIRNDGLFAARVLLVSEVAGDQLGRGDGFFGQAREPVEQSAFIGVLWKSEGGKSW